MLVSQSPKQLIRFGVPFGFVENQGPFVKQLIMFLAFGKLPVDSGVDAICLIGLFSRACARAA